MEEQLPLKDFEQWLYAQNELLDSVNDDFILELFTFSYSQKAAHYAFRNSFLQYFDKEEFMLWKVKANLRDLMEGKETRDRILNDFYKLGYDEFSFLQNLSYYMFELEDVGYGGRSEAEIMKKLKEDAQSLLTDIESEETKNLDFKISMF